MTQGGGARLVMSGSEPDLMVGQNSQMLTIHSHGKPRKPV